MLAERMYRLAREGARHRYGKLSTGSPAFHEAMTNWLRAQLLTRSGMADSRGGFSQLLDYLYPREHQQDRAGHREVGGLNALVQQGAHGQFPAVVEAAGRQGMLGRRDEVNLKQLLEEYFQRQYLHDDDPRVQAWLHRGSVPQEGDAAAALEIGRPVGDEPAEVHRLGELLSPAYRPPRPMTGGRVPPLVESGHHLALPHVAAQLPRLLAGSHAGHLHALLELMHHVRGHDLWEPPVTTPILRALHANAEVRHGLGEMHAGTSSQDLHDLGGDTPEQHYSLSRLAGRPGRA